MCMKVNGRYGHRFTNGVRRFAWQPVKLVQGNWVWLRWVEGRLCTVCGFMPWKIKRGSEWVAP